MDTSNLQIVPWHDKNSNFDGEIEGGWEKLDCECGRILTAGGVYTCPFLANDYRGRCGGSFNDYTKKARWKRAFVKLVLNPENKFSG